MPLNILITAVSRRVPLVRAFRNAVESLGIHGAVIGTDVNPMSPAIQVCDRAYEVPLSHDPGYLAAISNLCEAEGISLVVPTIDDELPLFAGAVHSFARRGVRVMVSPEETVLVCNDKFATCTLLRGAGVPAANSFLPASLPAKPILPAFVKPRRGRGSIGAFAARNRKELDFFMSYVDDPVIQEYLPGKEFTIDVMCDLEGRPLSIVPRERVVIRAGVIDRGRTVNDKALMKIAWDCTRAMRFAGPINIQCRMQKGKPTIFEINPRFSGGIPLTIAAGADFPRMVLQLARGRHVEPSIGAFQADLWMTSYESSFFLPPEKTTRLLTIPQDARSTVGAVA
jgi:carbamoyl-phosphate synthase large subunit